MKTISKIIAVVAATTALTTSAAYAGGGAGAPSITGHASATVVTPVTISESTPLSFGTFSASSGTGSGGTIDTSGNVTGSVNAVPGTGATPATFATSGVPGNSYTIVGPTTISLTDGASGDSMPATLFYPSSPRTLTGGSDTFNVTGVLTVAANQPTNVYNGTYTISVHY